MTAEEYEAWNRNFCALLDEFGTRVDYDQITDKFTRPQGDSIVADEFKIGDIVRLKCGGATMVIFAIVTYGDGSRRYECEWFVSSQPEMARFSASSLFRIGFPDAPAIVKAE